MLVLSFDQAERVEFKEVMCVNRTFVNLVLLLKEDPPLFFRLEFFW